MACSGVQTSKAAASLGTATLTWHFSLVRALGHMAIFVLSSTPWLLTMVDLPWALTTHRAHDSHESRSTAQKHSEHWHFPTSSRWVFLARNNRKRNVEE